MSLLLDAIIFATAISHVLLTPFTKVEESFNLHAVHDVLMFGVSSLDSVKANYDHFIFPGAVPRSFIGSVLLAWVSNPIIQLLRTVDAMKTKTDLQVAVRISLAVVNAFGLSMLGRSVSKRYGFSTAAFFTIVTCTQFHLPFWMSRTLPNMFALLPVNMAYSYILNRMPNSSRPSPRSLAKAISLLTFTSVVFRAELVLLLGPLALQALVNKWASFRSIVKVGLLAALASVGMTVLVDSYFWDKWPLWPELHSIHFNVYQGKSADWGVSPYGTYWTTYLPKLLMTSLPLAFIGFITESRIRGLLFSPIMSVFLLSFLGHKEWRFIIYTIPLFNIAAARGAYWMSRQRTGTFFGRLNIIFVVICLAINLAATLLITSVSRMNYPGGDALNRFNIIYSDVGNVHVHIDNLAAQSGATLFLQENAPPFPTFFSYNKHSDWIYNKTEHLTAKEITDANHFTHVITEYPDTFRTSLWKKVESIPAFSGFRIQRAPHGGKTVVDTESGLWSRLPLIELWKEDKLWILERR